MSLWSENLADAARKGGSGQVELDWDSYENAKQEISSEQLQLAEEKARTKEQSKMRAEEAAQARTEKMRKVAERKKERKERDRREGKIRKPKLKKENATTASRSNLKTRLTKVKTKNKLFLQTKQEIDLMILLVGIYILSDSQEENKSW